MKQRLQGLVTGLVIGVMVTASSIGVVAANFQAIAASFPIFVNGVEWKTDKPIVVIDGSTYLPLRALGDALGVQVEWNSELSRVEIGKAPQAPTNYSRTNLAPLNTEQTVAVESLLGNYTASVRVIETIRGDVAWDMIRDANMFNDAPTDGHEYILAKVTIKAESVDDDKTMGVNNYDFKVYSSNNSEYDYAYVVNPYPTLAESLFEGGNTEGYVAFQVKKDDPSPKMVYGIKWDGSGGIWFSLQ